VSGFTISRCNVNIPYGVTDVGPNDITAGSGQQGTYDYEPIWTTDPVWITMSHIMIGAALLIFAAFIANSFRKKRRRKQQIIHAALAGEKHCLMCGSPLPIEVNFCPGCGNEVKLQDKFP
jgi:hypothetical protein